MTYRFPSLNGLKAFEAAARHLSFKTAAAELGVTAGAVSQQVKRLEASLGVALFRRLPHGLLLTKEGTTYLPEISRAFDVLTDATEAIAPALNGRKLTLGIAPVVMDLLPKGWPRKDAAVDAYIRDARSTDDVKLIFSNDVDAILRMQQTRHANLSEREISLGGGQSTIYFVTRPGLADCRQSRAIIEALS